TTVGFPADDKKDECHIGGRVINVFRDDTPNSTAFYYVPPELRLVTNGNAPQVRFYGSIQDNKYSGLVQMQVTAALKEDEAQQLRTKIADDYKVDSSAVTLSPVGPIDQCLVGILFLEDKANPASPKPDDVKVLDVATAKPLSSDGSGPPKKQSALYGPT